MGAAILGRYIRVRWKPASSAILDQLQSDPSSIIATELLDGAQEAWGLAPSQPVLLTGHEIERSNEPNEERIILLPERPDPTDTIILPRDGQWLIRIEHSGSMWAALRQTGLVTRDEITFNWTTIAMSGVEPLVIGKPQRQKSPFRLVAPPPRRGEQPARRGLDGALLTAPFRAEKGREDEPPPTAEPDRLIQYLDGICQQVTPRYRYGILENGVMRWLDVRPGIRIATATPTTALLRARLALFGRELAARGIYYEDDAEETGYELRLAIEDGAVPWTFYEEDAALAYTVSGEGEPEEDKREQARKLFDPEDDWETGQFYAVDHPALPARVDVTKTRLVFLTSDYTKIDGVRVNDAWAEDHLELAGLAAGLAAGASNCPALTEDDVRRFQGATKPQDVGWNAVDAADRVQRAAYILVNHETPDIDIERSLSRLRGPVVRALLGRDALRVAETGAWMEAEQMAAALPSLAPGPFPSRAHAVIDLADKLSRETGFMLPVATELVALEDLLEQRLTLLLAERLSGSPDVIARGAAAWIGDKAAQTFADDARRWGTLILDRLLGGLELPGVPPVQEDNDRLKNTLPALRRALESGSAETFAATRSEADPTVGGEPASCRPGGSHCSGVSPAGRRPRRG